MSEEELRALIRDAVRAELAAARPSAKAGDKPKRREISTETYERFAAICRRKGW